MTQNSINALQVLRKTDNMSWYVIPLLIFVLYVYVNEISKKNWSLILLGISTFFSELVWEMFNALVLHFSKYAPLWSVPSRTSYLIYVGFNIEIAVLFVTAAFLLVKSLPEDKNEKLFGIPKRFIIPFTWGLICVFVEVVLFKAGLLKWDYIWWRWPHIYLIAFVYITPWFGLTWLHYNTPLKTKAIAACIIPPVSIFLHILFVVILGWI